MNLSEQIRHTLRVPSKYVKAVLRWKRLTFYEAPPIFANAKPKSGSHLLTQIMRGFCEIAPYVYVTEKPVRTVNSNGGRRSTRQILADIKRIQAGAIGWGYVDATPENVNFLCQPGRANYFIYRDPRDTLVSHVFFATDMNKKHGMHAYYKSLPNFNERLKVAITGIDLEELHMVNVVQRYDGVFRWLEQPSVLCIRFENLIDHRENTLLAILAHLEKTGYKIPTPPKQALNILMDSIQPSQSHTFRSGKTGDWKENFSIENKKLFKDVAGDLLIRLGYEKNNDW